LGSSEAHALVDSFSALVDRTINQLLVTKQNREHNQDINYIKSCEEYNYVGRFGTEKLIAKGAFALFLLRIVHVGGMLLIVFLELLGDALAELLVHFAEHRWRVG